MAYCERCGAGLGEPLPETIEALGLTFTEWRVVETLWRNRPRYVAIDGLVAAMYGEKGGSRDARRLVRVFVHLIRNKLKGSPWGIETHLRRGFGYRLTKEDLPHA